MPIVNIVAALEDDFGNTEGTRLAGVLRREVLLTSTVAQDTSYDHTVNAVAVETASTIEFEDAETIKGAMRNALRDEGYTVKAFAIQADIQTYSL